MRKEGRLHQACYTTERRTVLQRQARILSIASYSGDDATDLIDLEQYEILPHFMSTHSPHSWPQVSREL